MFSAHQFYTSAVSATLDNQDYILTREAFNNSCMQLTDLMVFYNLGLLRTQFIRPRIAAVETKLESLLAEALNTCSSTFDSDDSDYLNLLTTLYQQIVGSEVLWPIGCCVVPKYSTPSYKAKYTKSRFSAISNSVVTVTRNGKIKDDAWLNEFTLEENDDVFASNMLQTLENYLADPHINANESVILVPAIFPDLEAVTRLNQNFDYLSYVTSYIQGKSTFTGMVSRFRSALIKSEVAGVRTKQFADVLEVEKTILAQLVKYTANVFNFMVDDYNQHLFIEKKV